MKLFNKDPLETLEKLTVWLERSELPRNLSLAKEGREALTKAREARAAKEKELLSWRDYDLALASQSACNLSGIVRTFADITVRLWNEARAKGEATDFVNKHPISRLFAEQIYHLAGGWKEGSYLPASQACEKALAELKPKEEGVSA